MDVMCVSRANTKLVMPVEASKVHTNNASSSAKLANEKSSGSSGLTKKNPPPREMDSIRARYLHSLNIPAPSTNTLPNICAAPSHHALEQLHVEPLKKDFGEIDEELISIVPSHPFRPSLIPSRSFSSLSSSSLSDEDERNVRPGTANGCRKRGVSFDAAVTVKHVPMRTEYSNRVRCHLWTDPRELRENAQRNAVEFAFEGYDWRLVTTEDEMYTDSRTGTKIHPIHVVRYFQAKQRNSATTTTSSRRKDHFLKMSRKAAERWSNQM